MKQKEAPGLAKKLKSLREKLHLTQKEVADKAQLTESAYRAYELGDRNPKPESLKKIAKVLGVQSEYLSAPTFKNQHEFAYALLENEDLFDYTVQDINDIAAIAANPGSEKNFFFRLVHAWNEARKKLDSHEITQEEYDEWKRTWDNDA